ncbi:alpha-glucan family phosphorylase [Nocardia sp. NPDC003345]
MKALRRFTVRAHLPERLAALGELAANLRWSWHGPTQDVFAALDPGRWREIGPDPVRMLGEVPAERLAELAGDAGFCARVDAAAADLREYLGRPGAELGVRGIGYFSMEFGVSEVLPNYSGGLGILAGDHLKAASDLGLPLIGVGLLYRAGYFRQSLTLDGWQAERYPVLDPHGLPLRPLTSGSSPVLVHVAMPDRRVLAARVWVAQVGRVPLLLLDSDIASNDPDLRTVTDRLYGGDQEHRIVQEILAGIGGVRAVRAFTAAAGLPAPDVFHMNEGHAGFSGLERIREYLAEGHDFETSLAAVRAATVFTTHTPVPAGIDRFPVSLVHRYFGGSSGERDSPLLPGIEVDRIVALGREADPSVFNMAHMALRLAQRANGVSRLHGTVSREMFAPLWPGFDPPEVPIGSVTNGVHVDTWAAREWNELRGADAEAAGEWIPDPEPRAVWAVRRRLRGLLVEDVRRRVRESWTQRGAAAAELTWTESVFDPDVLTVGFARRVPTYKRLTLMLRDPDRLRALLLDPHRPVQLVVAGKSHPADEGGKALIRQLVRFADDPAVRHRIVFLPDYDIAMARYLYWGCDVWLNNPLRPLEACGTSGMKSALNGGLNLSIRDGWWDEMFDGENGWAIPTADGVTDEERRDDLEATALYELMERVVAPRFYERDAEGVPGRWLEMVTHTLRDLGPRVRADRMVREYAERYYVPAAAASHRATEAGLAGAAAVGRYRRRVAEAWPRLRVVGVDAEGLPHDPEVGAPLALTARVDLGGLAAHEVRVEAVVGRVSPDDELTETHTAAMSWAGGDSGPALFTARIPLPLSGSVGYQVRVLPVHELLASSAELALVATA